MSKYGYAVNGNGLNPSTEPVQVAQTTTPKQPPLDLPATYGRFNIALQNLPGKLQLGDYLKDGSRLGITDNSPVLSSLSGVYPNPEIRLYKNKSGHLAVGFSNHKGEVRYALVLDKNGKPLQATPENVLLVKQAYEQERYYIQGKRSYLQLLEDLNPGLPSGRIHIQSSNPLPKEPASSNGLQQLQAQIGPQLQEQIEPQLQIVTNAPQNQQENQPPQKQRENQEDFELA